MGFRSHCFCFARLSQRYSSIHNIKYRYYSVEKFNFLERSVRIQTCGQLYKSWRERKVLWKLPETDLTFDIRFIDTRPNTSYKSKKIPTVLALHGAPGSWKDYTLLSSFLHDRGCRVIVPTFPGN